MKATTKAYESQRCQNTLDIQLLPFQKTNFPDRKKTFYCIIKNETVSLDDCEKCQYKTK